jgi:hypothetical protein
MSSPKPLKFPTGENALIASCLSDKQRAAVELIAIGKTYQFVCDTLAIDRKTLYLWRQDEEFKQALSERRRERWSAATDRLQAMLDRSLDILEQHLRDRYDCARFRAATSVLRIAGLSRCMPQRRDERDE